MFIQVNWPWCLNSDIIRVWLSSKSHYLRNIERKSNRLALSFTHTHTETFKGYFRTTGLTYRSSCRVMLHAHSFDTPTLKQLESEPLEQLVSVSSGSNYFRKIRANPCSENCGFLPPLYFFHWEQSRFYLLTANTSSLLDPSWSFPQVGRQGGIFLKNVIKTAAVPGLSHL